MKLSHVTIRNFLSIRELQITFDPSCRILVGINESGKTNILKALNLLDPKATTTKRDLREPGLHEAPITSAFVRFVFTLTKEESSELLAHLRSQVLSKTYTAPIIKIGDNEYTLADFCNSRQGLYVANILTSNKFAATWSLDKSKILNKWKKVAAACPQSFPVSAKGEPEVNLKLFTLVDTSEFVDIPTEYVQDASGDDLHALTAPFIKGKVETNLMTVLFWDYEESKLLPPRINLDQFCATPEMCIPLKRMFQLYEIADIKKAIADARAGSTRSLENLLRRVAEKTSEHFHSIWREYEGITFALVMNGPDLEAGILDESNRYELAQRSDGFKRFVTFLLLVSAEEATNLMKDTLLLIDEPEIGLHPTGARYLRDELVDISKNNYVVFSTHSIFMIDNKIIKRHLIVKKKNEITHVEEVSESNIQDEEVIYKSLGYSMFSNLKERNLLFEGWRDKKLFETAISRVPGEFEDVKRLKLLGRCFAQGVKQIRNITPLFEAGDRKCLILSDSDAVSRQHQKDYQEGRGYGLWRRFDEILEGSTELTGEDFVEGSAFRDPIEKAREKLNIPTLPTAELDNARGKISVLKNWLRTHGVSQEESEKTILEIKDAVFDGLRSADVRTRYFDYLRAVLPVVEAL